MLEGHLKYNVNHQGGAAFQFVIFYECSRKSNLQGLPNKELISKRKMLQPLKISLFNFVITELSYNNCVAWEDRSNDIQSICCFSPKFSRINCNKYLDNSIIVGGQIELFKLFLHYPRPSKINSNKCLVTFLYFKAGFFWDFLGLSWVRIFNYHSVFSLSKCFLVFLFN